VRYQLLYVFFTALKASPKSTVEQLNPKASIIVIYHGYEVSVVGTRRVQRKWGEAGGCRATGCKVAKQTGAGADQMGAKFAAARSDFETDVPVRSGCMCFLSVGPLK
jgi:hypothetical protein